MDRWLVDPLHFLLNQVSRIFSALINLRASELKREQQLKAALSNPPYCINVDAKLLRYKKTDTSEALSLVSLLLGVTWQMDTAGKMPCSNES